MDKLWAPWRIKYIKAKKQKGCIFCRAKRFPQKNLVVLESIYSLCLLNTFPYNNGHLMACPKRHTGKLDRLTQAESLDLLKMLDRAQKLLDKTLKPHGYNIGINLSRSAGAGITNHLHIHIVPRWEGDTNFMPSIYGTKVISQSLEALYKRLKNA